MQTQNIVEIIDVKGTPVFFYDIPKDGSDCCHCRLNTSEELAILRSNVKKEVSEEELGVHILNTNIIFIYKDYFKKNSVAAIRICSMLSEQYEITEENKEIAFVLFLILHEIGHWQHFISSGLSRMDYWREYESARDPLWIEFQMTYNLLCRTSEEKQRVLLSW
ncbi:MAG: hypothetical protein ACOYJC_08920 [Christensenellales bacterium]|jgi:hypothetical protein